MARVALVTGASGGFGTAIVERLRGDGFIVEGGDLTELDVTDPASVNTYVALALERHGRVDVLVNNAGVAGPTAPVDQYPLDEWQRVLDVNLTGTFLCMRALRAADARARLRPDRQHRLGCREGGKP